VRSWALILTQNLAKTKLQRLGPVWAPFAGFAVHFFIRPPLGNGTVPIGSPAARGSLNYVLRMRLDAVSAGVTTGVIQASSCFSAGSFGDCRSGYRTAIF
jgi:hypothetical protein